MKITLLKKALLTLCLMGAATTSYAWPDKSLTVVVPWPPGGPSDLAARPVSKGLSQAFGQPVIIDNRPGAGGNIGTSLVAKAQPDGYTLLITASGPITINKHLYKNMSFDPQKDLQPITNLLLVPQVILVNPSLPVNNLQELIAYIKDQKGNFQWASAGNGTTQHMTGALFQNRTGLTMSHIPYKGSAPAITDVVGGHVPMLIDSTIAAIPMIKAGKLKPIAVSGKRRASNLPQVPTFEEAGLPGFESYAWYGLFTTAGTPKEVVTQINKATVSYMKSPEFKKVINDTGSEFVGTDPAAFTKFVNEDAARWQNLAPKLNLSLD
ncbi:tripartite tricarboxylate transporter substrate binding protein [Polynucleobacter sp. Fuers-14]|uniref:Bug family tripartite tricarboxylate transporter substrate binding protein n=1 Tax=Polynucleobacter sp. Fuers-14 TaxID=1758364 RepID=UPI001C0DE39D|nr:tripartite tricarboxylate transporter substrate binding protein [Polynucleobacter sp. Fuers-14]MBU3641972.1 tripartite tricarboxylate transporter substrate binding protein [Polynucleobacter sp. Fuers-14]